MFEIHVILDLVFIIRSNCIILKKYNTLIALSILEKIKIKFFLYVYFIIFNNKNVIYTQLNTTIDFAPLKMV